MQQPHTYTPRVGRSADDQGALRPHEAEFLDARGVAAVFGIKRSLLYELLNEGAIRSVSVRRRGRVRGKRLFDADSIRNYLLTRINAQPKELERKHTDIPGRVMT